MKYTIPYKNTEQNNISQNVIKQKNLQININVKYVKGIMKRIRTMKML